MEAIFFDKNVVFIEDFFNSDFATVSSKGQVTIPLFIRDRLHLSASSKIEYILNDNCIMIVSINNSAKKLKGMLPKQSRSLSIEEMNNIIRDRKK